MSHSSESVLDSATIQRIAPAIAEVFPRSVAACVFGSAARGEMRPFSDIDLGLLLPDEPDLMDLGELAGRVEDMCCRPVDIVRLRGLPERDSELAFRIADEGVPTGPSGTDWSSRFRSLSTSRARSWRDGTWLHPHRTVSASRRFQLPAFCRSRSPIRSNA